MNSYIYYKWFRTAAKYSVFLIFLLLTCPAYVLSYESSETGMISGRILQNNGKPASAGLVLLYKKIEKVPYRYQKYRPEPDEVAFIEKDGSFTARLLAGTYFIEVVQRESNEIIGPPKTGEYQMFSLDGNNIPLEHIIKAGEHNEAGDFRGLYPYEGMKAEKLGTGVTGRILDRNGIPVSDAVVFVYSDSSMPGNARFISDKTGKDGRYILGVFKGGTYYLGVRVLEDFPGKTGKYGGVDPAPLKLKIGHVLRGVDITY